MTIPPPRPRGRPAASDEDRRRMWTVSLSLAERDKFLKQTGSKTLTEAVRKLIKKGKQ